MRPVHLRCAFAGILVLSAMASCSLVNGPDEPLLGSGGHAAGTTNPFGGGHTGGTGTGGDAPGGSSGGGPSCGDGIIDSALGETCDPPAQCPTSCDDQNPCTQDLLEGDAASCTARCTATPVTVCAADGCCADGCTAQTDPDCEGCGDGQVVPPETCDTDCPTSCDDQNDCTLDVMQGTAASCNVVCSNGAIVACADGDGCCPTGCHHGVDDDCQASSVLIVFSSGFPTFPQDVQAKQIATGAFSTVDLWDAGAATPSLPDLVDYDAVLVFLDGSWNNPALLGDVLADYYDGGGRVVQALFALTGFGQVQGRFGDPAQGYQLMDTTADQSQPPASLGAIDEPNSPLMVGVNTLAAEMAYQSSGLPLAGATAVAHWSSGGVLVVRGTVDGRNRVDLNMYPASADAPGQFGFWTGDGTALIRNALLFQ